VDESMPNISKSSIDKVSGNAYRILGLPADALSSSISESTQSIRRALKLGVDKETAWDLAWLGTVTRNESSVQDAVSRLSNPPQRLLERLFWFSEKESIITSLTGEALLNTAKSLFNTAIGHECALLGLLAAVYFDSSFNDAALWINVINAWISVIDTDHYWLQQADAERTSKIEPQASDDEINQLRNRTLDYVISIIGILVKNAFSQDEPQIITRVSRILKTAHVPGEIISDLQNETIGALVSRLENICLEIQNECKTIHDANSAEHNRNLCTRSMDRIDNEAVPLDVKIASLIDDVDSNILIQAHEIVAKCLRGIAIEWTWADNFIQAESVLQRAKVMAYRTLVAVQIDEDLVNISANAKIQRDNEIRRKEVLKGKQSNKRSWGLPPILAKILALIIVAILYGLISSLFHTSSNNTTQSPQPIPTAQTSGTSNNSDTGNSTLSAEIDAKKQAIDSVEAQLNQINTTMDTYQNKINYFAGLIKEGQPFDQNAYQQVLGNYNALVPTQNNLVNEDESLVSQYKEMVNQYNAQQ
jgi:FlaG/FlaF family flagellin (archaellin)